MAPRSWRQLLSRKPAPSPRSAWNNRCRLSVEHLEQRLLLSGSTVAEQEPNDTAPTTQPPSSGNPQLVAVPVQRIVTAQDSDWLTINASITAPVIDPQNPT